MCLAGRVQPLSLIVASEFRREPKPALNAMRVVLALTAATIIASDLFRRGRRRGSALS